MLEHLDEEDFSGGGGLANRLWLPEFFCLHKEDVIAKAIFTQISRITAKVFVDQSHIAIVRMLGSVAIIAKVEKLRKLAHRLVRVIVVEWIAILASAVRTLLTDGRE